MKLFARLSLALAIFILCFSANIDDCVAQGAGRSALNKPVSIALDGSGAILIADSDNHCIRKVNVNDGLLTIVGNGRPGFSGDGGPAKTAQLNKPDSITIDNQDNLYIYDKGNKRIRKVNPITGLITTILGFQNRIWNPKEINKAQFFGLGDVRQIAVDDGGKNLYFIYNRDSTIYRLNLLTEQVDQIVNDEKPAFRALCRTYEQEFQFGNIALDKNGNIFASDLYGNFLLKISINTGNISVVNTESRDLTKPENRLRNLGAITVAHNDEIYFVENNRVWKLNFGENKKDAIAGNGKSGYGGDGELPLQAPLNFPTSLAVDRQGTLYICDTGIHRIRYIDRNGALMIFAD